MEDMTLREVCTALGVSRRAVQGYENESLVTATGKSNRGYLLYNSAAQERIKKIKLYQDMGFSLKQIKEIIDDSGSVLRNALIQQKEILNQEIEQKKTYDSYHSGNIGQSFLKRSGKLTSSKYITLSQGRNNTMKKKWLTGIMILTMAVSLTACGETAKTTETSDSGGTNSTQEVSSNYDNSTLEGIREGIESDFSDTIQKINEKLEETNSAVGNSYEEYITNKQLVTDWYTFAISEENALFERTVERSVEYYKLIAASTDPADYDARDDAMEAFYDDIYDDQMDNFYDEIYDDAMDDIYNTYYDGIVEGGYDVAPYEKWSEESSACYKEWSDSSSSIYKSWSDTSSKLYGYWSAVSSGFYQKNFDVDAIIQQYKEEKSKSESTETKSESTSAEQADSSQIDGIRPEFQEAMGSYEAFFDEYVSFMKEYENASQDDVLGMMDEYTDYLKQYTETMSKMEALDDGDLSTEEALYYAEVTNRISKKLIEVAQ